MDSARQSNGHDHVVQFYKTDAFLARVVAPFLSAGLRRGGSALIVCTIEHRSIFSAALQSIGLDIKLLRREKDLVWLDARLLRERLRAKDPAVVFDREIGTLVRRLSENSPRNPVHIFGELVDLLWAEGKRAEAVELEGLWNSLADNANFNLMCSYKVRTSESMSGPFRAVCTAHSHVLRPERPGSVRVLDDSRHLRLRHGEREMVFANRRRDQQLADGLREDLAQRLFVLILQSQSLKGYVPHALRLQLDEFLLRLNRLLALLLQIADDLAPVSLKWSSLVVATEKYAAMTERLFGVSCEVVAAKSFVEPDRTQRELLYAIVCQVVDRAARHGGSKKIKIKMSRHRARDKLAIYHDGDSLIALGAEDDTFRRLLYQSGALGARFQIGSALRSDLQLACRW